MPIHNNTQLTEIEKFNYLSSLLERSAHEAVSELLLSATNYQKAIESLKKRFGSKQQIKVKQMDALLHLEAVTSPHSVQALHCL